MSQCRGGAAGQCRRSRSATLRLWPRVQCRRWYIEPLANEHTRVCGQLAPGVGLWYTGGTGEEARDMGTVAKGTSAAVAVRQVWYTVAVHPQQGQRATIGIHPVLPAARARALRECGPNGRVRAGPGGHRTGGHGRRYIHLRARPDIGRDCTADHPGPDQRTTRTWLCGQRRLMVDQPL